MRRLSNSPRVRAALLLGVPLVFLLAFLSCKKERCACLNIESGNYVTVDMADHPTSSDCGDMSGQFLTECETI